MGGTEGLATEVSFSFAGQDIKRNIPAKQIFIENHPFKTNQKIKFTRPDSTQISISTESASSQFNLPSAPEFLYVVNKTPNTIGIKTGIGNGFNERSEIDEQLDKVRGASSDRYEMIKSIYYQNRNAQLEEEYIQNLPVPKIYIE